MKLVIETSRPIAQVARENGINEGTLGNWVNRYRTEHAGDEPPLVMSERARLRENRAGLLLHHYVGPTRRNSSSASVDSRMAYSTAIAT